MPNVGQLLKDEMARISRREIKKATAVLQRSSAAYRREIAALKRKIVQLERAVKDAKRVPRGVAATNNEVAKSGSRFSANGFRSLRQRLGLSAPQLAKLLDCSEQTIYNWEKKISSPRPQHLAYIVRLRGMGKRQVSRLLEEAEFNPKRAAKAQ